MKYFAHLPPNRSKLTRPSAAFTLVEILVVLAIIGILAAILFPVLGSVRANARAVACSSNLKQIGLGMLLYSQDNSGKLPRASGPERRCGWPDPFARYTRNAQIFSCPDDEDQPAYDPGCTALPDAPVTTAGSYTIVATEDVLTRRNPTQVILVADGKGNKNSVAETINGKDIVLPESIERCFGEPRHLGGYNTLFGDGHVKRLAPDKMLDPVLWGYRR